MGLRGGHEADVGLEKVEKEVSTVNSELESNLISNKDITMILTALFKN